MRLEIGQLPIAVRSPAAAIKKEHRIFAGEILWNVKRLTLDGLNLVLREKIANVKLRRHENPPDLFYYTNIMPSLCVNFKSGDLRENFGAGDRGRTGDVQLGKLAFYR